MTGAGRNRGRGEEKVPATKSGQDARFSNFGGWHLFPLFETPREPAAERLRITLWMRHVLPRMCRSGGKHLEAPGRSMETLVAGFNWRVFQHDWQGSTHETATPEFLRIGRAAPLPRCAVCRRLAGLPGRLRRLREGLLPRHWRGPDRRCRDARRRPCRSAGGCLLSGSPCLV